MSDVADEAIETYGTYSNLNNCLNSGSSWYMDGYKRYLKARDTFGMVEVLKKTPSIIPMCCQELG